MEDRFLDAIALVKDKISEEQKKFIKDIISLYETVNNGYMDYNDWEEWYEDKSGDGLEAYVCEVFGLDFTSEEEEQHMYNFVWDVDKEKFEACKTRNDMDCIGNVRVGNLCFDLIQRDDYEDAEIWIDCYVGGVDTGYGYGEDGYPYDYASGIGCVLDRSEYKVYSFEEFKTLVEMLITHDINSIMTYATSGGELVNLKDKANEPLKKW